MRHSNTPLSQRVALRFRVCSGAAALLLVQTLSPHAALVAQTSIVSPFRLETFGARNESAASNVFGGIALSGHSGVFGLRLSGAVAGLDFGGSGNVTTTPVRYCSTRSGCRTVYRRQYGSSSPFTSDAWSADADLIAEPFRTIPVLRQLLLGFSPYAFAGIGRVTKNAITGVGGDTSRAVWSYGLGVHHDLVSRLGVTGEARVRRRLEDNAFIGNTFRDAVQYRLGFSVGLGGGAGRGSRSSRQAAIVSRGPVPASAPPPIAVREPAAREPAVQADVRDVATIMPRVIDAAEALLESRYRDGGTSPEGGFDAGGFVQYVFAQEGVALPRMITELLATGTSVSSRVGTLRPGDLLFFANDGVNIDHVAIYVGRDRFVHASASGGGVLYDVLGEGERGTWFAYHLLSVRRVLGTRLPASRSAAPPQIPSGRPDTAPKPMGAL